jgi:hypothetical protein
MNTNEKLDYIIHNGDNLATLKSYPNDYFDSIVTRFHTKYEVDPVTGCHNWVGSKDKEGYGVLWDNRTKNNRRAHRVAMEIAGTPIPDDLQTLHQCDNKSCVNHHHLKAGTNRENQIEARDRGLAKDLTPKRSEYFRAMSPDDFALWEKRFAGKSGKALSNLNAARKWRAAV